MLFEFTMHYRINVKRTLPVISWSYGVCSPFNIEETYKTNLLAALLQLLILGGCTG